MKGFVVNNTHWIVLVVHPSDPRLIDKTGKLRVATADPVTHTISISSSVQPPLLDRVMLHEVAHAVTMSYDVFKLFNQNISNILDEWFAWMLENYSIEINVFASEALGRPVCVNGFCS